MLEGTSFDSECSLFETCSFESHYSNDKNERIKNSITDSLISQQTYEYKCCQSDLAMYIFIIGINASVFVLLFYFVF
jgi:hypothetical protein